MHPHLQDHLIVAVGAHAECQWCMADAWYQSDIAGWAGCHQSTAQSACVAEWLKQVCRVTLQTCFSHSATQALQTVLSWSPAVAVITLLSLPAKSTDPLTQASSPARLVRLPADDRIRSQCNRL